MGKAAGEDSAKRTSGIVLKRVQFNGSSLRLSLAACFLKFSDGSITQFGSFVLCIINGTPSGVELMPGLPSRIAFQLGLGCALREGRAASEGVVQCLLRRKEVLHCEMVLLLLSVRSRLALGAMFGNGNRPSKTEEVRINASLQIDPSRSGVQNNVERLDDEVERLSSDRGGRWRYKGSVSCVPSPGARATYNVKLSSAI